MDSLSRRDFLKTISFGAASLAMPGCMSVSRRSVDGTSSDRPNIIYILADDMGYGDPRCNNKDSRIPTPNIDRLAAEGMRFTDAHSGSAVCTPTRYGVLTGRYCWRSRLKARVLLGYDWPLIEPGRLTAASLLKRNGYATGCIGKWHLGLGWQRKDGKTGPWPDRSIRNGEVIDFARPIKHGPTELGFDYFYGISASLDMPPYTYIENDHVVAVPTEITREGGRKGLTAPGFKAAEVMPTLTKKASEYIEKHVKNNPDKPFFLHFLLTAPHTPIVPLDSFKGRSKAGDYGDFVAQVDWTIGQVAETLDELGISNNTLLIVTSDNGPEKFMHARKREYNHYSAYHFRGCKRDAWDGGHRIPFIARWPRKIKPGATSDETVCLTDLMATCAAIVGAKLPDDAGEDSYNILPVLLGQKPDKPIREATVHCSVRGKFAIRQGEWKLILCKGSGGNKYKSGPNAIKPEDPAGQLYNMAEDVSETKNLYLERPDVVERLTALLEKYRKDGRSRPRT